MSVSWTTEQQQVIDLRKRNILVSAAAGSGKTAVLVERIRKIITDKEHPVDIDRLLIVTFTNAAAAEMRERIGNAIEKALEEQPADEHLLRQMTLIHNAQITTIDSFCLYVIRNHFHEIDLEPNFRIGDEGELKLLKEDILKKVLEGNYETAEPSFSSFVDGYAPGRGDGALGEMILRLYEFSRSYPWPEEWLDSCAKGYDIEDAAALNDVVWMKPLVENIRSVVLDAAKLMRQALALTQDFDGPDMYERAVRSDLEQYEAIASAETFTGFYEALRDITYERLASAKGYTGSAEKQEKVKELRDAAKKAVKKLNRQYFFCSPDVMVEQLRRTAPMAEELVRLTKEFASAFADEKKRKNLVDFHDLEHFALRILVDEETKEARGSAEEFRDTFEEIMIDEYQDSNHVQETILKAISREARGGNNIFMVGDVKQSIYRFRLARPELFMEKYDTYSTAESEAQRIDLHKNFRSRDEVLSFTNDIFYRIMSRDLGNVEYDEEAALYPGASYPKPESKPVEEPETLCKPETEDLFAPEILLADSGDELLEDSAPGDKKALEATMVAAKIRSLMENGRVTDKDTGELRKPKYSDIVILLRSVSGWADQFAAVLNGAGIPAHTLSATGYFSAVEVQTVLSMLRILDNPRQDIPLTAVLRSPIVGLDDEELALLRLSDRERSFHACVLQKCEELSKRQEMSEKAEKDGGDSDGQKDLEKTGISDMKNQAQQGLEQKLCKFYEMYQKLRKLVPDTPIHELIEILLKETGYGAYAAAMPAGNRRHANLMMLVEKAIAYENTSYKGLFHFVRYIDELQKYDVDFGEADMVSENEDVVRIMSIHKSKGLEFPVVFVSGLGKNFNRQDVRSHLVLHPELGLGMDCMDGKRRIKSPTIAKKAIAKQIDLENLGEELRVLYVALTRAKEKLILTGTLKDAPDAIEKLRENETAQHCVEEASEQGTLAELGISVERNQTSEQGTLAESRGRRRVLSYMQREGASGYLDWILPAIISYGEKYPVQVVGATDLVLGEMETQIAAEYGREKRLAQIRNADTKLVEELAERFSFVYPYPSDILRKNKYSVSELKHRAMRERLQQEEEEVTPAFLEEDVIPYIPAFAREMEEKEEDVNRGALRGTAVHRVMECYQFSSEAGVAEQIEQMLMEGKITEDMKALVKLSLVEELVQGDIGKRMRAAESAGKLYREKPFVMGFTEEELERFGFGEMRPEKNEAGAKSGDKGPGTGATGAGERQQDTREAGTGDLTLIQGIIDVFWMEDDGIVLLDYKTDRVDTEKQLADRYEAQLKLYAEALERIYNSEDERTCRVKEKLLYSFRFGKVIPIL